MAIRRRYRGTLYFSTRPARGTGAGSARRDTATAEACLQMGLYISFAGMLTYKNAQALRDVAAKVPLEIWPAPLILKVCTVTMTFPPWPEAGEATSLAIRPKPAIAMPSAINAALPN